tara:strand:- start:9070 stop:9453 length:384 start_codon:yes stop_codon:yes gene_type:complete
MQTIIENSPRSTKKIESPHVEIDLDLSPFLKIDMVDTIQPITTSQTVSTPVTTQVKYTSVDGPYTRKRDGASIMYLRQDETVRFDPETGEMFDDSKSRMLLYTPERMEQCKEILSTIGYIYRTVTTK